MAQCNTCRYYVNGVCERYPPDQRYQFRPQMDYPRVDPTQDACGEYKA